MDYLELNREQIAVLAEAGSVEIGSGDRLNRIGSIWLWAYSEPQRKAQVRAAAAGMREALASLWNRLDGEFSVGFADFCELFDDEGATRETPISIDTLQNAVGDAMQVVDSAAARLEPAPSHRISEDWMLPYVCLLLLEFERLGGAKTTGSKNQQIRRNSNRDDPSNPRYLFVQKFTECVKRAFDIQFDHVDEASRQFIALMTAKIYQRNKLVRLIKKADKLREEEGQAAFVKRFPVYLHDEVYAVINAE